MLWSGPAVWIQSDSFLLRIFFLSIFFTYLVFISLNTKASVQPLSGERTSEEFWLLQSSNIYNLQHVIHGTSLNEILCSSLRNTISHWLSKGNHKQKVRQRLGNSFVLALLWRSYHIHVSSDWCTFFSTSNRMQYLHISFIKLCVYLNCYNLWHILHNGLRTVAFNHKKNINVLLKMLLLLNPLRNIDLWLYLLNTAEVISLLKAEKPVRVVICNWMLLSTYQWSVLNQPRKVKLRLILHILLFCWSDLQSLWSLS